MGVISSGERKLVAVFNATEYALWMDAPGQYTQTMHRGTKHYYDVDSLWMRKERIQEADGRRTKKKTPEDN